MISVSMVQGAGNITLRASGVQYISTILICNMALSDRLEIDIYIPFVNHREANYLLWKSPVTNQDLAISADLRGRAIGDCSLMFKYQVIPEKEKRIILKCFRVKYISDRS